MSSYQCKKWTSITSLSQKSKPPSKHTGVMKKSNCAGLGIMLFSMKVIMDPKNPIQNDDPKTIKIQSRDNTKRRHQTEKLNGLCKLHL